MKSMRGKRAAVLGGAGFVGSHLCERLLDDGAAVVCVDNYITGSEQNLRTLTSSAWRFILIPVLALAVLIVWRAPGRIHSVVERFPGLRAGLIGIAVAGTLGYAVNDSGIAVPGMMLAVLTPAALFLLARFETEPPAEPPPVDHDAERREPVPA